MVEEQPAVEEADRRVQFPHEGVSKVRQDEDQNLSSSLSAREAGCWLQKPRSVLVSVEASMAPAGLSSECGRKRPGSVSS